MAVSPTTTYVVRYRLTGQKTWLGKSDVTTNLGQALSGLQPGATYDIQVLATNESGTTQSKIMQVTMSSHSPSPPGLPVATQIQPTSLVLNWGKPSIGSDPITYQVQRRTPHNVGSFTDLGSPITSRSMTVTGLVANTTYDFQVVATNALGSATSPVLATSTLTLGVPPSAPGNLTPSTIGQTQFTITWQPSSGSTPITYQTQYRVAGATPWTNWGAPISQNSTIIAGLAAGTSYDVQIIASNSAGSATSNIQRVTTATAVVAPGAPGTPTAGAITSTSIVWSWTASGSGTAPITYQPQFRVSGASTFQNFGPALSGLTVTLTNLQAATAYEFRVVAANSAGSSTSGNGTASTIAANIAPGAPTLTIGTIAVAQIQISWTTPTGTAPFTYQPQFRLTGGGAFTNIGSPISANTVAVTGLAANTGYDFQVIASNSAGTGTSAIVAATTLSAASAWNASDKSANITLSGSNLTATTTSTAQGGVRSTTSKAAGGKYAFEFTTTNIGANERLGIATAGFTLASVLGASTASMSIASNGVVRINNVQIGSTGPAWVAGGKMQVVLDLSSTPHRMWYQVGSGYSNSAGSTAGSQTGSQTSGVADPVVSGPASMIVGFGQTLAITGIGATDASWPAVGSNAINLWTDNGGLISMKDAGGTLVSGSGTTFIGVGASSADVPTELGTITYTAPSSGTTDALHVEIWDQNGNNQSISIPVTLSSTGTGPGDPAANTGGYDISTLAAGPYFAAFGDAANAEAVTVNFGATTLAYAVPSGFAQWDPPSSGATGIPPSQISAPVATGVTSASATLTWGIPSAGDTPFTYQPQFRATGTTSWLSFGSALSSPGVTINGLNSGTSYDFQIIVTNASGSVTSPTGTAITSSSGQQPGQVSGSQTVGTTGAGPVISGPLSGSVLPSATLAVTGITVTDTVWPNIGGQNFLSVNCTSGKLSMNLAGQPAIAGSGTNSITTNTSDDDVKALLASLTYTAPAGAATDTISINIFDEHGQSNTMSITVNTVSNPNAPGNFVLTPGTVTQNSVALTWTAPSGVTPINYSVQYRLSGVANWTSFASTTSLASTVTGLQPFTAYEFRVQASNSAGINNSNQLNITSGATPTTLPTDGSGQLAYRIADMMEIFGTNCFPSGQDGSKATGTNTASAYITGLSYICGGSGMGMFNRLYGGQDQQFMIQICQALPGTKFTSAISYDQSSIQSVLALINDTSITGPGYLYAVEGYNEPDNPGVQSYDPPAPVPVSLCLSAQQQIYAAAHPKGIIVMSPSVTDGGSNTYLTDYMGGSTNQFIAAMDWSNGHDYPNSGSPSNDMARRSTYLVSATGKPCAITEFEPFLYNSQTRTEQCEAYFGCLALIRGFADFKIKALQWWSFYDYNFFPQPVGLFRGQDPNNPTPAASTYRAMFQLCKDTSGAARRTFNPGQLSFTISPALPPNGRLYVFQSASSGQFYIYALIESNNPGGTPTNYTITHAASRTRQREYWLTSDPVNAMTVRQDKATSNNITFALANEVKLIVVDF
jgi:hypothetical protein